MDLRPLYEGRPADPVQATRPLPPPVNPYDEPARQFLAARSAIDAPARSPRSSGGVLVLGLGILLAVAGYWIGNNQPLWGNFLEKTLAAPGSPARLQLAYEHAVGGGLAGLVVGMLALLVQRQTA